MSYNGKIIYNAKSKVKIVDFATGSDKQISAMLEAHYRGDINIGDYWHVGDTRVMHLNAMEATSPYADESHVAQDMTMVIIGIEHDTLKEQIGTRTKAAITLQCREILGDNGTAENGYIFGTRKNTVNTDNYSNNPRRTWLNDMFIKALPIEVQPLVKTVIKKNLANHSDNTAGPSTEDKAFLTSFSEMFGNISYNAYTGSTTLEGEQYAYYSSNELRKKCWNNNGIDSGIVGRYWLRSPSSQFAYTWVCVSDNGSYIYSASNTPYGLAPAFCL